MKIELTLPGERSDAGSKNAGFGEFAEALDAKVVAATDVTAARRGRAPAPLRVDAEDDDVLELGWEDGIVELVRAGKLEDHFDRSMRSAEGRLEIPTRRTVRSAKRGTRDINLDSVAQIRVNASALVVSKAVGFAFPRVLKSLEKRNIPEPGLHRVDPSGGLAELGTLRGVSEPYLVLLHGTFSSTAGGFSHLFESEDWARLTDFYGDRILALEQHTVTESPAGNALQLASKLPKGARLHLLSHSRGGLVGDLLCRYPWEDDEELVSELFSDPTYVEVVKQLTRLARELGRKELQVERFVRVAAPAAGTLLASKRLDTYLNVLLSVLGKLSGPGAPAVAFLKAIATAIVSARTKADQLPGIEAMMPHTDRGFVPFLNLVEKPRGSDLAVIAGDVRGGGVLDRVKDFFSHLYYREDNDFVVDSRSMFRGPPRKEARGYYYRSSNADHFSYFAETETRERMVEWLVEGREDRFFPLNKTQPYGGLRSTRELRGDSGRRAGATTRGIPSTVDIENERKQGRPVVFLLPGIMGSHLALDGDRQWIHVRRLAWGGLRKLAIDADGVEPHGLVEMVYEKLYDRLGLEYHVIPLSFDWRRPIRESALLLAAEVEKELAAHELPVRIIAHSMGGLVSRSFIVERPDLWAKMVRRGGRLLMLGTPNFGSYVPAQVMTREHKLMKTVAAADLRSSLDQLTDVVRAFPGLVEMLPFKNGTDLLDAERWKGFGDFVPNPGVLAAARAFRTKLDGAAIEPEHMVYVAGHAEATPAAMERVGSEVSFRYTALGDGTVPWDLGRLEGVDTYYVEAEHGQIPNYPPAFDGFLELLGTGRTSKLATAAPAVRRGVGEDLFELPPEAAEEEELRYFPDESDLIAAMAGEEPQLDRDFGPPIELSVTSADAREAKHPVLVGHYAGDRIVSAEAVLDGEMGGRLSRDLQLQRYVGPVGSVRIYTGDEDTKPPGVIVTGLGEVGRLRRVGLEDALGAALMEYALANLADEGEPPAELRISSLLIGTYGGTRITIEDSIAALVDSAIATNERLDMQNLSDRAAIRGVEIVELYLDIATEAAHAARRVAKRNEGFVKAEQTVTQGKGSRRSRPNSPYSSGWARRIQVRTNEDGIAYEVTTDLARSEPMERSIQWAHVDALLDSARQDDPEAAATLFQYLLPLELIGEAANMPDLVMELDSATARIPWELLDPPREEDDLALPLGARVGFLRTLSTPDRRLSPRRARGRRALVIGEPAGVSPALPGAKREAEQVRDLLRSKDVEVEDWIAADADEIFRALYRYEYDIVHIAAHGEFHEAATPEAADAPAVKPDGEDAPARQKRKPSGVVLGEDRYLGSGEFENLRAVPSVVFLNCCHLGKMDDGSVSQPRLRQPGRLAASVAEELIKMGVGVVVAAGWAVDDLAAETFAKSLYGHLLGGSTLIYAVREARRAAHDVCSGGDVTWGAYQVYGDPGYVLPAARGDGLDDHASEPEFVAPHEMVEYISDFSQRGRGGSKERQLELKESLERLEQGLRPEWAELGEIQAALGDAYASLGFNAEAIERYIEAVAQSDAPLKAVEQLANIESRAAEKIAEDDPKQAAAWFEDSLARVSDLCRTSPSSERHALIGATLRRRAKVASTRSKKGRAARERDLAKAREEYAKACELQPRNLYYPLSVRVSLDLGLDPAKVTREDIDEIERSAQACARAGDEWSAQALADAQLLRFLAFEEGSPEESARAYARACNAGAGATQRERDSMMHQLESLVEFVKNREIKGRVEKIRSLLESIVGEDS